MNKDENKIITEHPGKVETTGLTSGPATSELQSGSEHSNMPFGKVNFIMMGICIALIILGFALMSGGGSAVETEFNPEIFSTRRLVVGPTIAFLGFLCMAFAIIRNPRGKKH